MLGTIQRPSFLVLWISLGLLGCAGAAQVTMVSGSCSTEFDGCMKTCSAIKDSVECELSCRFRAKQCARAQGTTGKSWLSKSPRLGDYQALLVDLSGRKALHSKKVELTLGPAVGPNPAHLDSAKKTHSGHFVIPPGSHLAATFELPEDVREAELILTHAPGGEGTRCFITVTMGSKTIVGRYAPPRVQQGRLKEESWNLTPDLGSFPAQDGKRTMKLFLYNNETAGSTEPYHLASVELHYRAMEAR